MATVRMRISHPVTPTRLPWIQQCDLRLVDQRRNTSTTYNAHRGPRHGSDETVPRVLLLDVPGNEDIVGNESGPDEIETLDGVRDDGGLAGNTEQNAAAASHRQSRIGLPAVSPTAIRIGCYQPILDRIPDGATGDPDIGKGYGRRGACDLTLKKIQSQHPVNRSGGVKLQ